MTTLGDAATQLNQALNRAEDIFCDRFPGVTADVELRSGERLSFQKHEQEWGLVVVRDHGALPLMNASLEVRVAAASKLMALYFACSKVEQLRVADIVSAIRAAEEFATEATCHK